MRGIDVTPRATRSITRIRVTTVPPAFGPSAGITVLTSGRLIVMARKKACQ
jgi:hypothetical protein